MHTSKNTKVALKSACFILLAMFLVLPAGAGEKSANKRPPSYTESIPGTLVKFEMVGVPAGEILMPDPSKKDTTKRIKIKPFWIGKTEVTWDEYDVFVYRLDVPEGTSENKDAVSRPSKPYGTVDRGFGHKGYPAINVSYYGAEQYCKWLSAKTGRKYRLPTEAEWEYACRAGMPPPTGEKLADFAWFWQEKTQPVEKKEPNAWGIHDMLGNVAEWCTDLSGKPVLCGGAFDDIAKTISPSARKYQDDSWQANDPQSPKSKWWLSDAPFAGFRVIRVE
ncbi:MAG: SUMF1/EgtB/PvdO family nonheme iron enzyme [Armatimonadota bacterium]|nr:SUMF1/EgtB/PvdO family nonheme iron enzyme [Armatimonadota bacterium]